MSRCRKCAEGIYHSFEHGQSNSYEYHGCRCKDCSLAESERARQYRISNADYVREGKRRYYEKNRREILEHMREYRTANREQILETKNRHYDTNRDRINKKRRKDYLSNRKVILARNRKYHAANREKIKHQHANYYAINREACRNQHRKYRLAHPSYHVGQDRKKRERRKSIPAPRHKSPWTAADDVIILRNDISYIEMAYLLGRTYKAVDKRRQKLRNRIGAQS